MSYVMKSNLNEINYAVRATVKNMSEVKGFKVSTGAALGDKFPKLALHLDEKGQAADFFASGPFWIVSKKAKDVLGSLNADVEYHSIDIYDLNNNKYTEEYYFANFVCSIDCLDYEHAKYEMDDNYIDEIYSLVINEDEIMNVPVLRMKNTYDDIIIVNDGFVNKCNAESISGVYFIEPKNWKY